MSGFSSFPRRLLRVTGGLVSVMVAFHSFSAAAEAMQSDERAPFAEPNRAAKTRPVSSRALPAGVRRVPDIEYVRRATGPLLLDLYLPEQQPRHRLPVVVWIHGGGWKAGSKASCRLAWLGAEAYAVASIGYRLSTSATWPAQIEDARAAIRWLREHALEHSLDGGRIAVAGESSGANLAALVGTLDPLPGEGAFSRVRAVIDFFGTTDIARLAANVPGPDKTDAELAKTNGALLLGGIVRDRPELARAVSPYYQVSENDPPFLIIHGDQDTQVPVEHSLRLHERLKAVGVRSELIVLPGAGHGGRDFDSPQVHIAIRAFLRRALNASP